MDKVLGSCLELDLTNSRAHQGMANSTKDIEVSNVTSQPFKTRFNASLGRVSILESSLSWFWV